MPHTPRLCIDGRAADDFPARGMLAQELIDQLVAAQGEAKGPGEWVEKQRTVLVSHPKQVFSGQLRRFDTRRRIGFSPLYWLWETKFAEKAEISAFHRFRPAGRLRPSLELQTLNTLIGSRSLPSSLPFGVNHRFIVPSRKEAKLLQTRYQVPETQVYAVQPTVRRYVHFSPGPAVASERGYALFLRGPKSDARMEKVLKERFPNLTPKSLSLDSREGFAPNTWLKWLERSSVCFYLDSSPFDWGTLALEALYWRVPVVFSEKHAALSELMPDSALGLNRFLVDGPSLEILRTETEKARADLAAKGVFDPFSLAHQYADIYGKLLPIVN